MSLPQQRVAYHNLAIQFSVNLPGRNFQQKKWRLNWAIFSRPFSIPSSLHLSPFRAYILSPFSISSSLCFESLLSYILPPFSIPSKFRFASFLAYISPPLFSPRSALLQDVVRDINSSPFSGPDSLYFDQYTISPPFVIFLRTSLNVSSCSLPFSFTFYIS